MTSQTIEHKRNSSILSFIACATSDKFFPTHNEVKKEVSKEGFISLHLLHSKETLTRFCESNEMDNILKADDKTHLAVTKGAAGNVRVL